MLARTGLSHEGEFGARLGGQPERTGPCPRTGIERLKGSDIFDSKFCVRFDMRGLAFACLLYTFDAADEEYSVDACRSLALD